VQVLLTGCTGFLGSELARALLLDERVRELHVVIRPAPGTTPVERLARLVEQWDKFVGAPDVGQLKKIRIVEWDLDARDAPTLSRSIDHVIHCAAVTELGVELNKGRRANLFATQNLVRAVERQLTVKRFIHLSTAYVSGKSRGLIREDSPYPLEFHNHYELTKRESEQFVAACGLPYTILRPSIIVGRSDNGFFHGTKVLYSVWRMWLSGHVPRAPIDPSSWVDIVPVDFVVNACLVMMDDPETAGGTFHLCAGDDRQSPKTIMLEATRAFEVPVPPTAPSWYAYVLMMWPVRKFISHTLYEILKVMYHHLPYLGIRNRCFDMSRSNRILAKYNVRCAKFRDYGYTIFRFCKDTSWGKKAVRKKSINKAEVIQLCSA
jgi:nucleoside-diphosphate-sugar epimerase